VKRLFIAVGVVAVIAVTTVGVLRWREMRKREEYAARMLPEEHADAILAAGVCDTAIKSLTSTMTLGTARFGFYLTSDRRRLAQALGDVVTPILSSRQTACEHARTLLELYIQHSPSLDADAVGKLARTHAHLTRLAALAAAMQATRDAITAGASDDELRRHFERLRAY
jgi:hypothetical protein